MDRRRLEEAFLLSAAIEVIGKYDLPINNITYDKNELAESVLQIRASMGFETVTSANTVAMLYQLSCELRLYMKALLKP